MNRAITRAIPVLWTLAAAGACSAPEQRPFTLDDAARLRLLVHPLVSPDGQWVAYAIDDSLWVAPSTPPTDTPSPGRLIATGMSIVSNEARPFAAWSPDSRRLLFRADTTKGGTGDRRNPPVLLAEVADSPEVRPLWVDSIAGRVVPVHAASFGALRGATLGGPTWSPDGRHLAFLGFPVTADGLSIGQVWVNDLETGALEQVASDATLKTGLAWSPDGDLLAYAGGGGGGEHWIAVRSESGSEVEPFTGAGPFFDLLWSPDGSRLLARSPGETALFQIERDRLLRVSSFPESRYFGWTTDGRLLATSPDGMSNRLSLVDIRSGSQILLTGPDTIFSAASVSHGVEPAVVAFVAERGDTPPDLWTARLDAGSGALVDQRRITNVNPWVDSVAIAPTRIFRWTSAAGTELESLLFSPTDPDGAPPLVVMPYGCFANRFPGALDFMTLGIEALTADGWAVIRPNTRGICNEPQTEGYGRVQLEDTHLLLDALATEGLADTTRVVLFGHSHGATMVYYYLTHSRRFRGGIAVNGAADWVFQAERRSMTGLPGGMGGLPSDLPVLYDQYSPYANAAAINVPLLAVVGDGDTQIPPDNGRAMVDTLRSLGKEASLLAFPDETHWIFRPENRQLFWSRVFDFLALIRPD